MNLPKTIDDVAIGTLMVPLGSELNGFNIAETVCPTVAAMPSGSSIARMSDSTLDTPRRSKVTYKVKLDDGPNVST